MSCLIDKTLQFITMEEYVELVKKIGYEKYGLKIFDNFKIIQEKY